MGLNTAWQWPQFVGWPLLVNDRVYALNLRSRSWTSMRRSGGNFKSGIVVSWYHLKWRGLWSLRYLVKRWSVYVLVRLPKAPGVCSIVWYSFSVVASLAAWSAKSFPGILTWLGTQWSLVGHPLWLRSLAVVRMELAKGSSFWSNYDDLRSW